MLSEKHKQELKNFIEILANKARKIVEDFHQNFSTEIEIKKDKTPVTLADKNCEKELRNLINSTFPSHGIIGEEFGNENENAEFVWSLDPIDGTKSFLARVPLYGILIGLLHEGKPLLGLIDQPISRERIVGDGKITKYNGVPVRVSETQEIENSLLLTTDLLDCEKFHPGKNWNTLLRRARLFRTWGDCYGYMLVSNGRAEIMADPVLSPWDLFPLLPILKGAGAEVSNWRGNDALAEISSNSETTSLLAANPILHEKALKILNS